VEVDVEAVCFATGCIIPICWFLTIVNWIKGIRYKKSKYFRGKVIYSRGTKIVVVNSRRGEIYETYTVSYDYKGKTLEGEVCTSEKGLEPGDDIFVYIYDPEGVHEIQSDIAWRKFKFSAGFSLLMTVVFLISWSLRSSIETTAPQTHSYTHFDEEEMKKLVEEYLEHKK
jgi:hypothetical protein